MSERASPSGDRDDPLRRIATALATRPAVVEPAVFHDGVAALRRYLGRRFSPQLSPSDVDDLAVDAVTRMYEAARGGLVRDTGNPTGYLLKMAVTAALARLKTNRRDLPADWLAGFLLTDDEAAARLDQLATADTVHRAMRTAHEAGDVTAVRVATYLLDEIQRTGIAPSNRRTAEILDLSHTGVAKALHRLRQHIEQSTEWDTGPDHRRR